MHFLEKGQKIRAWVDPPPLIRAMPERKRFFFIDVFPYRKWGIIFVPQVKTSKDILVLAEVPKSNFQPLFIP